MNSFVYDNNNVFAKILRDELPWMKVYKVEYILAFEDKYPKAPIHILVIPKDDYIPLMILFLLHIKVLDKKREHRT